MIKIELKSTSGNSKRFIFGDNRNCDTNVQNGEEIDWYKNFPGYRGLLSIEPNSIWNRIVFKFEIEDDALSILKALDNGVTVFGIDMNQGCLADYKRFFGDLDKAVNFRDNGLQIVKYIFINPRFPRSGYLKDNINKCHLELDDKVILTSDRFYSAKCTKKIIYINSKSCLNYLGKCDIVQVANVRMKVSRVCESFAYCIVVFAGSIKSQSPVVFPSECNRFDISTEEIEDINIANEFKVHIIVTPNPGCEGYLSTIKKLIPKNKQLFTKIMVEHLNENEHQKWILNNYDGFFVDVDLKEAGKRFMQLDKVIAEFIIRCYERKKPIVLTGFKKESLIDKDYLPYFCCFPDKFMLQKEDKIPVNEIILNDFLKTSSLRTQKFAIGQFNTFVDNSTTNSDTFAAGIVSMSITSCSDAIIIYSYSGRMAIKISHYRPPCPIISFVKKQRDFISIFYNIYTITGDETNSEYKSEESVEKTDICCLTPRGLMKALDFCSKRKFIEQGSEITIVFRSKIDRGFQNKFTHLKYNTNSKESDFIELLE